MKLNTATVFIVVLVVLGLIIGLGVYIVGRINTPTTPSEDIGTTDFFSALFPFGNTEGQKPQEGSSSETGSEDTRPVPQLRKVSEAPTAGGVITEDGRIRFIEKETGHIFETTLDSYTTVRLSNTTISRIQSALWVNENTVILRHLDSADRIQNMLGIFDEEEQKLSTKILPSFDRIALAGSDALTVTETAGGSRIDLFDFDRSTSNTLFTSPFSSWIPLLGEGGAFLATPASREADGFVYELRGQTLNKVTGGLEGFISSISPSGRYVLYSYLNPNLALAVFDRETSRTYDLPAETIASKCAWLPELEPLLFCSVPTNLPAGLPDLWSMGAVSFSDEAWIVTPARGSAKLISRLEEVGGIVDIINPSVNDTGTHVLFTNKNDSSLWVLDLSETDLP